MLYRARKRIQNWVFSLQIGGVLETPPIAVIDAPWSIISMVSKSDILMYVLSIKAFYRHIKRGNVIAIVDRDTPKRDIRTLETHVKGLKIEVLEDIDPGSCQIGGTWERLVYLVRYSEQKFAIQMDCDTLVIGRDIDEVVNCAENNIPFTYSDFHNAPKILADVAEESRKFSSNYVGIALERTFSDWPDAGRLKYARASSGFAGFSIGGFPISALEEFHDRMKQALGSRWREWGTEQSGSNYAISNSPGAIILPFPQYATFRDEKQASQSKFLHFIGSRRFNGNFFARHGRRIIRELNDTA